MDILNLFTAKQWIFIILLSYGLLLCGLYRMHRAVKELKDSVDNHRKILQTEHVTQNRIMNDAKEIVIALAKQCGVFQ